MLKNLGVRASGALPRFHKCVKHRKLLLRNKALTRRASSSRGGRQRGASTLRDARRNEGKRKSHHSPGGLRHAMSSPAAWRKEPIRGPRRSPVRHAHVMHPGDACPTQRTLPHQQASSSRGGRQRGAYARAGPEFHTHRKFARTIGMFEQRRHEVALHGEIPHRI